MSEASDLIEKWERETGSRVDDPDSPAMAGLFGTIARLMGKSNHQDKDDFAAGCLIRHQISPEGQREEENKRLMADMLRSGLSPDDIGALFGGEK